MTSHPIPRKISFTGSVATGKKVAAAAAPDLKRVTLELGGNDAAIVLPRREPEGDRREAVLGRLRELRPGLQRHQARLRARGDVRARSSASSPRSRRGVKVGNGLEDDTQIGPLNNRPQFERVNELVEDAKKNGARIAAGGEPMGGAGYFYRPTVVAEVADGVRLVDEEQFGPALPDRRATGRSRTPSSAPTPPTSASAARCGSANAERAAEVAKELECGTAWVNQHLAISRRRRRSAAPSGRASASRTARGACRLHRAADGERRARRVTE